MITVEVAVALSVWTELSHRRLAALIDRLRHDRPPGGAGGSLGLDVLVGWLEPDRDPGPRMQKLRTDAERALDAARRLGLLAIPWGDVAYPPLLAAIPDPPVVLWVRGSAAALAGPAIAIVGSRTGSHYGIEVAERLAADLASQQFIVVSGLARGVDGAAHRGALDAGGVTLAVLGCGPDRVYPPEHERLAADVAVAGALVSEYPPGTPALSFHFPMRNRIISGLSIGVVVVEAAVRSGSLITAECALQQGREVMAVPGSVLTGRHAGTHGLIKDGAALVEEATDVLAVLGRLPCGRARVARDVELPPDPLAALVGPGEALEVDELVSRSGLETAVVLVRLLELEIAGVLRRTTGGRFVRCRRNVLP